MRFAFVALLVALLAPTASGQVVQRIADLRLATAVRLALVDDVRTRPLDVTVVARDGAVAVTGDVPQTQRRTVDEVARAVPGVRGVSGLGELTSVSGPVVTVSDRPAEPSRQPAATGPLYHTVERGDTLFGLARRYDTTVGAILDLNGTRSTDIRIGQRLRVR